MRPIYVLNSRQERSLNLDYNVRKLGEKCYLFNEHAIFRDDDFLSLIRESPWLAIVPEQLGRKLLNYIKAFDYVYISQSSKSMENLEEAIKTAENVK